MTESKSSSPLSLSHIRRDQFPLWQSMRSKVYSDLDADFDKQEMQQIHQHPDWFCFFVTNNQGKVLGLVELSSRNIVDGCLSSPVAYLEGLYLEPEYRRQGLGKRLMEMILEWSRQRGFRELATDAELDNTDAQAFYRTLGFEENSRVVEFRYTIDQPSP